MMFNQLLQQQIDELLIVNNEIQNGDCHKSEIVYETIFPQKTNQCFGEMNNSDHSYHRLGGGRGILSENSINVMVVELS